MSGAAVATLPVRRDARRGLDMLPELQQGFDNLRAHKLRSALTMLGMIFGVAAVIAMLSIGAGAQQQVIAFIEQLGVHNVIVEAREAGDNQALQKIRKVSAGLSFQDLRSIQSNVDGLVASTARKKLLPTKLLPKPQGDVPMVYGVSPPYQQIAGLRVTRGRFFNDEEDKTAAPVVRAGSGCDRRALRRRRSARPVRQGQRAVVPRGRRGRSAAHGAGGRRRPAGAGPEQPDLHPALLRNPSARGLDELAEGRNRRRLCHADAVRQRRRRPAR